MYTNAAKVCDLTIVQGPFSVAPCQTLALRFAFASLCGVSLLPLLPLPPWQMAASIRLRGSWQCLLAAGRAHSRVLRGGACGCSGESAAGARQAKNSTLLEMDWVGGDSWAVTHRMPIGYVLQLHPSCLGGHRVSREMRQTRGACARASFCEAHSRCK
jgi:hypothetical protein